MSKAQHYVAPPKYKHIYIRQIFSLFVKQGISISIIVSPFDFHISNIRIFSPLTCKQNIIKHTYLTCQVQGKLNSAKNLASSCKFVKIRIYIPQLEPTKQQTINLFVWTIRQNLNYIRGGQG